MDWMEVGTAISVTIVRILHDPFSGAGREQQRSYEVNVSVKLDACFHKFCVLSIRAALQVGRIITLSPTVHG
jgi:hypothetical protein